MSVPKRLTVDEKLNVQYAIPLWLRDEQIKLAIQRVKARIQPQYEPREEPIALVCYGPSLNDTWEKVRDFRYVMTCSGAHRFMVERGVVPTWHVEVDPRQHKVKLMGPPQVGTEYLIASTCHQAVFDHLEGFNVKLWHVFDSKEDGLRTLPHGEWALTGGCSVGLRTITIAAFFGFRDLHIFGMDGCEGASGKHAAEHPNQPSDHQLVEYPPGSGVDYRTTASMLECAKGTWHELDQLPKVRATFYGEGLVQAMARDYKPRSSTLSKELANTVGVIKPALISAEYCRLNAELHRTNLAYGVGGGKHADLVLKLVAGLRKGEAMPSVLDYGCGKGYLAKALPFPIWEYDPAVEGKDESPRPADLVVATDVLEHIEPDRIVYVLDDIRRVTRKLGFFVIHTGPSSKTLADGRNTHILQRDQKWWTRILGKFFRIGKVWEAGPLLYVLVEPGKQKAKVAVSTIKSPAAVTPPAQEVVPDVL